MSGYSVVLRDLDGGKRAEWLAARLRGLGGSDAAPAVGLSEWRSPLAVWIAKTGRAIAADEPSEAMGWGLTLEPILREVLGERLGVPVHSVSALLRRNDVPVQIGSPDAWVGDGRPVALAELKVVGPRVLSRWAEGPPIETELQALHYAAITGLPRVYIGALLGGVRFEIWPVDADAGTIQLLTDRELGFWRFVESDEPPPVDGTESSTAALEAAYPDSLLGERVELPVEARQWIIRRRSATEVQREAEERQVEAENALRLLLGNARTGLIDGQPVIERRAYMAKHVDLDALRAAAPDLIAAHTTEEQRRRWWTPKEEDEP